MLTQCLMLNLWIEGMDSWTLAFHRLVGIRWFQGVDHLDVTELPLSVLDDDYCDCSDGADEPHTAACERQFWCANVGSIPRKIRSTMVKDGVQDSWATRKNGVGVFGVWETALFKTVFLQSHDMTADSGSMSLFWQFQEQVASDKNQACGDSKSACPLFVRSCSLYPSSSWCVQMVLDSMILDIGGAFQVFLLRVLSGRALDDLGMYSIRKA